METPKHTYLNQFHKESEERKMKKIQESKSLPRTYESVMQNQHRREQQTAQLEKRKEMTCLNSFGLEENE